MLHIVGQGIAGTLLAWELEQCGIEYRIVDVAGAPSASRIAAGIMSPVSGRRFARAWRAEELMTAARSCYRAIERVLRMPLLRDVRIRRLFRDDDERRLIGRRKAEGMLLPYLGGVDEEGFWIEGAARLDVVALLEASRLRWIESGRLIESPVPGTLLEGGVQRILCTGAAACNEPTLRCVPWQVSHGELITVSVPGLDPGTVLNRGNWIMPMRPGVARVGATYEPGVVHARPTPEGRSALQAAASGIFGSPVEVMAHDSGLRLTVPDKLPVVGRVPGAADVGVFAGLGSKGAMTAPWLAAQWRRHLETGHGFEPEVAVSRFF